MIQKKKLFLLIIWLMMHEDHTDLFKWMVLELFFIDCIAFFGEKTK